MLPSFVITFRETLEAALIVGIILGYLTKTRQIKYKNFVYAGVALAILASIAGALFFTFVAGGFTGRAEKIFEGVTLFFGAFLLTTMIMWMMKQKHITADLENKVAREVSESHRLGLFLLAFVTVLREGIETVIFLGAASFVANNNNLIGALGGIMAAMLLGYAIFIGSMKINLKRFFNITSILLILFAAGLVAYGVHEFQEAGIIPTFVEELWDINPSANRDGSYPPLHEKGAFGSLLKGLFGYNGNPSLLEVSSYFGYLIVVLFIWKNISRGFR